MGRAANHGTLRKASGEWDGMPSVATGMVGFNDDLNLPWSYINLDQAQTRSILYFKLLLTYVFQLRSPNTLINTEFAPLRGN